MSEDNLISLCNEKIRFSENCQSLTDIYANYQKFQNEISFLRKKIIELEGNIVNERNIKYAVERKCQKALQDLEHYKIKSLIEKHNTEVCNEMPFETDFQNIYIVNEENIKKNLELELKVNELENRSHLLERTNFDFEMKLEEMKCKNNNLSEMNNDLKKFVENIKSELLEMNELKLKNHNLETSTKSKISDSSFYLSFAKIDELQVKCFKLENENKKFKENHMNLLLLAEENASLSNRIKILEEKLSEFDSVALNKVVDSSFDCSNETITDRKLRHLERENEILKAQQTDLFERNSNLSVNIDCQSIKVKELEDLTSMQHSLIDQKQREMEIIHNRLFYLTKECESYKKVLYQFSEQSVANNDGDVAGLLECLGNLYETIESHKIGIEHQSEVLAQLTSVIAARIENYENNNLCNRMGMFDGISGDQKIIFELKQQVEQLSDELEKKSQLIEKFDKFNYRIENTAINNETEEVTLEPEHYREMGFSKNAEMERHQKNRNIFKKLTEKLLSTIQKILGYTIEMGPNGYVSVQNCLSDDPLQLLEFKIDNENELVLIDNIYSRFLKNQINFQSFPVLLSKLTLDLFDRKENF